MSTIRTGETSDAALIRTQAEAAAWIALLHSPERNADIEAGLRRWIAEHPTHAQVWEVATDLWNDAARLPRHSQASRLRASWSFTPLVRTVLAACVLLLVGAGFGLHYFLRSSVTTAVGEQRALSLEDGTRIELNTDTRLVVKYDRQVRTIILQSGEAYFQVAHESRPFVVLAGDRKVIAVGTEFTVRRDETHDDAVTVTLIEGRVAVAPAASANILPVGLAMPEVTILSAGQRLKVHSHARPAVDVPKIDTVTGWMRGQLIFDHTPLREAAAEFSRYSSGKIIVASAAAAEIPIGGIFRVGDSRSFARAVAESHNLKLIARDGDLVLE